MNLKSILRRDQEKLGHLWTFHMTVSIMLQLKEWM